jgi:hypothetical protein
MKEMNRDGLIQANLSVILAIVVLLAFATDIVGEFKYNSEKEWLKLTHIQVGVLFLFSALGLFSTMVSYYLPERLCDIFIKWGQIFLLLELIILFIILTRYIYAAIYGIY